MRALFEKENIEYWGVLPLSACEVRRPDIMERRGLRVNDAQSVILFLVPYFVNDGEGNISLYARSGDYHAFCDSLFSRLVPALEERYGGRFFGFADKSPIQENVAASMAGLGVIGDNFMIINEKYGSFVFLAEIFSTVSPETLGFSGEVGDVKRCSHCGACRRSCPMVRDGRECLSAVTQKKGELSEEDSQYLRRYGYAWGCDICQLSCPMTQKAIASGVQTPISFFYEDRICTLTEACLSQMDEETFRRRSFSWRGRESLMRNLKILSKEE